MTRLGEGLTVIPVLLAGWLAASAADAPAEELLRPLLVTVDDLPLSAGGLPPDPEERKRLTVAMLEALEKHDVPAVGLVTWANLRGEADLELLAMWLDAGHELGNHSNRHLSYTRTDAETYIADIESARAMLAAFLEPRGRKPRFFRFPMLHEGDTPTKLEAMRSYLAESGQRNLPVTIDNQDWSFERPWTEGVRRDDQPALRRIAAEYQEALRVSVRHHERTGDRLFDRPVPQILLLHAGAVGADQWDAVFTWLEETGHRFATADEVLADPAFAERHAYVAPRGPGLWERLAFERHRAATAAEIRALLEEQSAAWSRGDIEIFCSVYAEDAVFVSPSGLTTGRQAVLDRYRARYPDKRAMGTLSLEILEMRPAAGMEVSLLGDSRPGRIHGVSVVARWTLSYEHKEDASGLTLIVLRRGPEGWLIVQDASM